MSDRLDLQRAQLVRAIGDLISATDELADDEQIEMAVGLLRELFAAYYQPAGGSPSRASWTAP